MDVTGQMLSPFLRAGGERVRPEKRLLSHFDAISVLCHEKFRFLIVGEGLAFGGLKSEA
jgi:hypothetical protein